MRAYLRNAIARAMADAMAEPVPTLRLRALRELREGLVTAEKAANQEAGMAIHEMRRTGATWPEIAEWCGVMVETARSLERRALRGRA